MRFLTVLLVLLLPTFSFAMGQSSGGMERMRVYGFYSYEVVAPNDVNNYINAQATTPKMSTLNTAWSYGGFFGYMVSPNFEVLAGYDQASAKNPTNTTAGTNSGVEEYLNAGWGGLEYWALHHGIFHLGVAGLAGYPTYAHASVINSGRVEYDSTFSPIYQGYVEGSFTLGKYISIDLQGGYQYALLNALSYGSTAQNLKNAGANVNFDMSGWRAKAGLSFHF